MYEKNEHFEFEHERVDHTLKAGTHDSNVRAVRTGSVRLAHTGSCVPVFSGRDRKAWYWLNDSDALNMVSKRVLW